MTGQARERSIFRLILIAIALLSSPGWLRAADPPTSCDEIENAHLLDFWIGEWEVVDADENPQGTNRIQSVLDGCAVLEHWTGVTGFEGRSLFYYHSWLGQWRQVWITAHPLKPGTVKEKRLIETLSDGGVRFRGEIMISPENYVQDRTTLRPLPDGRVHQLIEWSNDDGRTWNKGFEGFYRRARLAGNDQ